MIPDRASVRLTAPSILLALVLVSSATSPAIARDGTTAPRVVSEPGSRAPAAAGHSPARVAAPREVGRATVSERPAAPPESPEPAIRPPTPHVPAARPVAVTRAKTRGHAPGSSAADLRGRDHVWIPSLGVSRSISSFSCSSKAYPGNQVYQWGCAGSNNIYLFGHASSVFAPLHDAYVAGRLRKGMALYFAGGDGVVHRYLVRWWRVTTPDDGSWAYASQSTPSLTLQTCVGAASQYRLIVRLVRAD